MPGRIRAFLANAITFALLLALWVAAGFILKSCFGA